MKASILGSDRFHVETETGGRAGGWREDRGAHEGGRPREGLCGGVRGEVGLRPISQEGAGHAQTWGQNGVGRGRAITKASWSPAFS